MKINNNIETIVDYDRKSLYAYDGYHYKMKCTTNQGNTRTLCFHKGLLSLKHGKNINKSNTQKKGFLDFILGEEIVTGYFAHWYAGSFNIAETSVFKKEQITMARTNDVRAKLFSTRSQALDFFYNEQLEYLQYQYQKAVSQL